MENKFEFSTSKEGFDNHILNSIPGYDVLLKETIVLSNHWLNDNNKFVIDIGGSTGKLLNQIQKKNDINIKNKFFNVDPTNFKDKIDNEYVTFINKDAEKYLLDIEDKSVQIFFSLFTLQFLSKENRKTLLRLISEKICNDGVFFISEKFFIENSEYQELFSVVLRDIKRNHFSDSDILEKDKKLLKHLKLTKEKEFLNEMKQYNFNCIKYWQSLHFNGFICTKTE